MGRKSALTEKQWAAIGQRLLKREAARALAREFGVSEAAIKNRFDTQFYCGHFCLFDYLVGWNV